MEAVKEFVNNPFGNIKVFLAVMATAILIGIGAGYTYVHTSPMSVRADADSHIMAYYSGSRGGSVYFTDYAVGCPANTWLFVETSTANVASNSGCWGFPKDGQGMMIFSQGEARRISGESLTFPESFNKERFADMATRSESRGHW